MKLPDRLKEPDILVYAALFLGALFLRMTYVHAGLGHCDEVLLAQAVEKTAAAGTLHGAVGGRYGAVLLNLLFYLPYHALTGANAEKVILYGSLVTGAGAVAAFAFLYRTIFGSLGGALLAGVFLATNRLFLNISTGGKENVAQTLFLLLGFSLAVLGAKKGSRKLKAFGFLLYAFSVTVHETALSLLPVFLLLWLFNEREPVKRVRSLALEGAGLAALLALPFFLYIIKYLRHSLSMVDNDTVKFLGLFSEAQPIALAEVPLVAGWPCLALAVLGSALAARKPRLLAPLLLMVATFFYYANLSAYTTRYQLLPLLALLLLAAHGGEWLANRAGEGRRAAVALAVMALAVGGAGFWSALPLLREHAAACGPKEVGLLVKRSTPPNAVVVSMDMAPYFEYYGERKTYLHPQNKAEVEEFATMLATLARGGTQVYADDSAFSYDHRKFFLDAIRRSFVARTVGKAANEPWNGSELAPRRYEDSIYQLVLIPGR